MVEILRHFSQVPWQIAKIPRQNPKIPRHFPPHIPDTAPLLLADVH